MQKWKATRSHLGGLVYFLAFGAIYSSYYYSGQYLHREWGVSLGGQGYLALLACACSFFGSTLVTALADVTRRHELVLCACSAAYAISFCLLAVPAPLIEHPWLRHAYACAANTATVFFSSAMFPLVNNSVARILGQGASGRHMLWGSVGQGVASAIVGACIASGLGERSVFVAVGAWSASLCLVLLGIVLCSALPPDAPSLRTRQRPLSSSSSSSSSWAREWTRIREMGRSPAFLAFMFATLASGIIRGLVAIYLPFYLRSTPMGEASVGTVYAVRVAYEATAFLLCDIVAAYVSHGSMFRMGILAGAARCLLYAIMDHDVDTPHYALAVEVLKGANTALTIYAGTRLARSMAPAGAESTAQGLFSGVYGSASTMLAGSVGWASLGHVGAGAHHATSIAPLFVYATYAAFLSWPACLITDVSTRKAGAKRQPHHQRPLPPQRN